MSNKSDGNTFEKEFAELLGQNGFWVHNLQQNVFGQPADIIAARNGKTFLIDCKVCANDTFCLSRIEENQALAMNHWQKCGNGTGWFALKFTSEIYMVPYPIFKLYKEKKGNITLGEKDIKRHFRIGQWIKENARL